jgi:hypothetical protein
VKAEVPELIAKLGHDLFEERNRANDRIVELIKQRQANHAFIEEQLRKSGTDIDDTEVRVRAGKLLRLISENRNPDDDPPPSNMRQSLREQQLIESD